MSAELAAMLDDKKPRPALTLYEIANAFEVVEDALLENGGDLTDEIVALLDQAEGALEWKVERICRLIRNHEGTSIAFKTERERLQAHERAHARSAESLKTYLFQQLTRIGKDKVNAGVFKVALQHNSRPSIAWQGEPDTIPGEFKRVKIELNGDAAYAAYKANALPSGFTVVTGLHVRIR